MAEINERNKQQKKELLEVEEGSDRKLTKKEDKQMKKILKE